MREARENRKACFGIFVLSSKVKFSNEIKFIEKFDDYLITVHDSEDPSNR